MVGALGLAARAGLALNLGTPVQGGGVLPAPYLGIVASRNAFANYAEGTNLSIQDTTFHFACDEIVASRLLFANCNVDGPSPGTGTFVEQTPACVTTREASIEIGGTRYQYLWGGQTTGVGNAGELMLTDLLEHPTIPEGQNFITRNKQDGTTRTYQCYEALKNMVGEGFERGPTLTSKVMTGTMAVPSNNLRCPPLAVLGMTRKATIVMFNNSRGRGLRDTLDLGGAVGSNGLAGAIERSLAGMAVINASVSSDALVKFLASSAVRRQIAQYASHVIGYDTINDTTTQAKSALECVNNQKTFVGLFTGKPVSLPAVQPYSNAGNTAVNAQEARRLEYNTRLRAGEVTGLNPANPIVDVQTPIESTVSPGLWASNSYCDSGGLHELQAGALKVVADQTVTPSQFTRT